MKFYSVLFRFDICLVQCLVVYFFTGHSLLGWVTVFGQVNDLSI